MRVLAAGFNAHGQLLRIDDTKSDNCCFNETLTSHDIHILYAGWSETLVGIRDIKEEEEYVLQLSGNKYPDSTHELYWDQDGLPACCFGTHDGLIGCISYAGDLYVMLPNIDDEGYDLTKITKDDSPRIRHLAIDGTGKVCVIPLLSPGSTTLHPLEFECFGTAKRLAGSTDIEKPAETKSFLSWFLDPSDPDHKPLNHHLLPGPCKQLVANAVTFSLLNDKGQLFTWGDYRYPSAFGRPITGDNPANVPHLATAANSMGTKIDVVFSGGTITAAKTDHRGFALIWGTHVLGGTQEQVIENLQTQGLGEASLIQLGTSSDAFPASVTSISVGDGHVLVVDDRGTLWGTGRNDYGQLGLGEDSKEMVQEWKKIEIKLEPAEVIWKVVCGDLTSFVIID